MNSLENLIVKRLLAMLKDYFLLQFSREFNEKSMLTPSVHPDTLRKRLQTPMYKGFCHPDTLFFKKFLFLVCPPLT